MILAIDPGTTHTAWALLELPTLRLAHFSKDTNEIVLGHFRDGVFHTRMTHMAIEMPASYGMAVGQSVFDTCFWAGRFWEASKATTKLRIFRKSDVCMNLCQSMRAKDGNVRQALIDRFGPVGTKANQGWFYGVSADVWQAIAVGVTAWDLFWSPERRTRAINEKVEARRAI